MSNVHNSSFPESHFKNEKSGTGRGIAIQSSHKPKNISRTLKTSGLGRSIFPDAMLDGAAPPQLPIETEPQTESPALASNAAVAQSTVHMLNDPTHSATTLGHSEQPKPTTMDLSGDNGDPAENHQEKRVEPMAIKSHPLEVLHDPAALQSHLHTADASTEKPFPTLPPDAAISTTVRPPTSTTMDPHYGADFKTFVKELLTALRHTLNATKQSPGTEPKRGSTATLSGSKPAPNTEEGSSVILRMHASNGTVTTNSTHLVNSAGSQIQQSTVPRPSTVPSESLEKLSAAIKRLVDAIQKMQHAPLGPATGSNSSKPITNQSVTSPAPSEMPVLPAIVVLKEPASTANAKPSQPATKGSSPKNISGQFPPLDAVIIRIRTPTGSVLELHANSTSSLWKDVQQMLQVFQTPSVVPLLRSIVSSTTAVPPVARPTKPFRSQPPTTVPKVLKAFAPPEDSVETYDYDEVDTFMGDNKGENDGLDLKPKKYRNGRIRNPHRKPKKPLSPIMRKDSVRSLWALVNSLREPADPQDLNNPASNHAADVETDSTSMSKRPKNKIFMAGHGRGINGKMFLVPLTQRPSVPLANKNGPSKFQDFDESLVYKEHFGKPAKLGHPTFISNPMPEPVKPATTKRPKMAIAGRGIAPVIRMTEKPTTEATTTAKPIPKGRSAPAVKGRSASGSKQTFTLHDVMIMALMNGKIKP